MKKLGTILEEAGVIDEIQLVRALSHQRKWRCRLGKSLIELGFVDEDTIAKSVAQQLGIPFKELDPAKTPGELFELIPQKYAQEKMLFPIGYDSSSGIKSVLVALSDPTDEATLKELEKIAGIPIAPAVGKDSVIEKALGQWKKYQSNNPKSNPEDMIASAHKDVHASAGGDDTLEGAEVLDDEWHNEPAAAPPPAPPPIPSPPPAAAPVQAATPPNPEEIWDTDGTEEILSVSELPSLDGEEEIPEIEHAEPWEQTMPDDAPKNNPKPEDDKPDVFHAEPWEHTMPDAQAVESATEAEEIPGIEHAEPWEQTMPGEPAATGVPINSAEEEKTEILQSEPWEHIMPGVDAAASEPEPTPVPEPEPAPKEAAGGSQPFLPIEPEAAAGPTEFDIPPAPVKPAPPPPPPAKPAKPKSPPPPPPAKPKQQPPPLPPAAASVPPPPPPAKAAKKEQPQPAKAPKAPEVELKQPSAEIGDPTLADIMNEIKELKAQVGLIRNELSVMRDILARRNEK